jgi:hypothetical protein
MKMDIISLAVFINYLSDDSIVRDEINMLSIVVISNQRAIAYGKNGNGKNAPPWF